MSDFDFSDINLDFLQSTPPKKSTKPANTETTLVKAQLNVGQRTNKERSKRCEWAKKIANVDQLLKNIQHLKSDNLQLQTQLKDFQKSALDIQSLYTSEKRGHEVKAKALQELQQKYERLDTDLVVKSLKCEQFEACLANQKERPVDYNELAVKYLRLVHKLDGEDSLKCFQDRSMVEDLKQYCAKYKLKLLLPPATSPKKPRSRTLKVQKEDAAVQCELIQEQPAQVKPERKNQSTQCHRVELRTQGTQHISTMTTRSTTTSCFIKFRNVGTNFPETQSQPGIDDILKEFAPWQNITAISPLIDQLQDSPEVRKSCKTVGTCTWLCNIRRSIDFIPRSKLKRAHSSQATSYDATSQGIIKQEVTTPSPSPTPNEQPSVPIGQNATSATQVTPAVMPSQNITVNPLIATINNTSQLSQVASPSFHELWHIFGRMIMGLLQTTSSSAGIAATNQEAVNQQQFHNWLRELYDSSVAATTAPITPELTNVPPPVATNEGGTNSFAQTEERPGPPAHDTQSVGTSPLRFNESSMLTSSILRPQARRSHVESQEMNFVSAESDYDDDISRDLINSHNPLPESLPSCNSTKVSSIDNFNCDSNSTVENEIPYLHLVPNPCNTTKEEIQNPTKTPSTKSSKRKRKNKILDEIQELFPQTKLTKDKQKALKRLLKPKKHKKKSSKDKQVKQTLEIDENVAPEETAVDFLKSIIEKNMEVYKDEPLISSNAGIITQYENTPKTEQTSTHNGNINNIRGEMETKLTGHNVEEETYLSKTLLTNNSPSCYHTVPQAVIYDNKLEQNARTQVQIDETFSFTKPAQKYKKPKSKYYTRKELYTSLFGDSDTELEASENEEYNTKRNVEKNLTIFTTEGNIPASSNVLSEQQESKVDVIEKYPDQATQQHAFVQPMLLFDDIDKENQRRLETIIDKELEKLPQTSSGAETISPSEDFPSDFEKDLELSSDEECAETIQTTHEFKYDHELSSDKEYDDKHVPSNTFTTIKEVTAPNETFSEISTCNNETSNFERDFQTSDMNVIINDHIQPNTKINTHTIQICNVLNNSLQFNSSMELEEDPNQNMVSKLKLARMNGAGGDVVNQLKYSPTAEDNFAIGMAKTRNVNMPREQLIESEILTQLTNSSPHNFKIEERLQTTSIEKAREMSGRNEELELMRYECNGESHNKLLLPDEQFMASKTLTRNSKIEERLSTTSTEGESSIIEISSDFTTDIETTRDASRANEELEVMRYECGGENHKERERGKPGKLIIKEEIVFYAKMPPNSNHCHDDLKSSTEILNTNSSFVNVAADVKLLESPNSATTFSFAPDHSQIEQISTIKATKDETSSIIQISNDIRDFGATTPTDELMIDEDDADCHKDEVEQNQRKPTNNINADCRTDTEYLPENNESTIKSPPKTLQNSDDSLNTSEISSILNSSLYKDILNDSIMCPIVDDILLAKDADVNDKKIVRCGRKRKSESKPEAPPPPCKRSERIKAMKTILGQSLDLSLTPVEIGKYTRRVNRNSMKLEHSFVGQIKKQPTNVLKTNEKDITATKFGFFKEIYDKGSEDCRVAATEKPIRVEDNCFAKNEIIPKSDETLAKGSTCSEVNGIASRFYEDSIFYKSETTTTTTYPPANHYKYNYNMSNPSTSKDGGLFLIPSAHTHTVSMDSCSAQTTITSGMNKSTAFKNTSFLSNPPYDKSATVDKEKICGQESSNSPTTENTFDYSESPLSPSSENEDAIEYILNTTTFDIPLELSPEYRPQRKQNSLLESLISIYSPEHSTVASIRNSIESDNLSKKQKTIANQYNTILKEYCCNTMNLDPDIFASKLLGKLQQQYPMDWNLILLSILNVTKEAEASHVTESELPSIIQEMPPRHLSLTLQRLFYLLKHLQLLNHDCCSELLLKIETQIFSCQQTEKLSLDGCLHVTQLYLICCKLQEPHLQEHPGRLFIARSLYCYSIKAILMIHEMLMWYPTAMPHREDPIYDRSDALITVIQHCLMCYKYDMEKPELRGKALISKLRYEYHYEPFMPTIEDVASNLVEKLKSSKFKEDISFTFGLFCKRLYPIKTESLVLQTHLLPLANEYFNEALQNTNYDDRISALLEIISVIIKPFPLDWNIEVYLNLFSRFLHGFNRKIIQEAAVCSILRLQRFGYVNCFNRLRSFKPSYQLESQTQAMFKTFVHRKKLSYLKTIQAQNPINLN